MRVQSEAVAPPGLRTVPSTAAEQALVRSAEREHTRGLDFVGAVLQGFDATELAEATDDGVFSVLAVSDDVVGQLVADATWDVALRDQPTDHPYLKHVVGGAGEGGVPLAAHLQQPTGSPAEHGRLLTAASAAALTQGDTLILNRIDQFDHGALRQLCEALERVVGAPVAANAYVSRDGAEGFGAHWDDHAVLVVPLHGRKLWEVFAPAHLSARPDYVARERSGPSVWSGVLSPGQALLIPRGWPHRVVGLTELSVHYTVGFNRPSYLEVLDLAVLGGDLSPDVADVRSYLQAVTFDGPALVQQVLAATRGSIAVRPAGDFMAVDAWLSAPGSPEAVEPLVPGAPSFVGPPEAGTVSLYWGGFRVTLSEQEATWLGSWPPPASDEATQFAAELLVAGFARLRSP